MVAKPVTDALLVGHVRDAVDENVVLSGTTSNTSALSALAMPLSISVNVPPSVPDVSQVQ